MLTSHTLPKPALLEPFPHLQKLFLPLAQCIKKGDLYAFDQALKEGEDEFVKRRIYLPLERTHDICLRNLLRKVFTAGGFEEPKPEAPDAPPVRRTRVTVPEFTAAINISSKQQVDTDEVECQLANMIYKVRVVAEGGLCALFFKSSLMTQTLIHCTIGFDEGIYSPRKADRGA